MNWNKWYPMRKSNKLISTKLYLYPNAEISANETYNINNINIIDIQNLLKDYGNVSSILVSNNVVQISIILKNKLIYDLGILKSPVLIPNTNLIIYSFPNFGDNG